MAEQTFILKRYAVAVDGYGEGLVYAKNKNQARMRSFDALKSANAAITFKGFLQIVSQIRPAPTPDGFGRKILVGGKPAHWIEHAGGNSVRFSWPGGDKIFLSHESDIEEMPNG